MHLIPYITKGPVVSSSATLFVSATKANVGLRRIAVVDTAAALRLSEEGGGGFEGPDLDVCMRLYCAGRWAIVPKEASFLKHLATHAPF